MRLDKKEIPRNLYPQGYRIPLFPTEEQREFLDKCIDINRFMYNWSIEQENIQWEKFKNKETKERRIGFFKLAPMFTKMRAELDFLQEVPHNVAKNGIKRAEKAFDNFFEHRCNRPKFKRKKDSYQSFETVANRMYFEDNMLKIQGLKSLIYTKWHSGFNKKFRQFKQPTISRDNMGNYYISFSILEPKPLEYSEENNIKPLGRAIGIDLNNENRFVLSTGEIFKAPDLSKEYIKLAIKETKVMKDINRRKNMERNNPLKYCQSKRANKRQKQFQKQYKRITNIVTNFNHNVTKKIINMRPDAIVMENLEVDRLKQDNHFVAANIHHANFGQCIQFMKYKSEKYGIPFIQAAKDYPSTQLCSSCGNVQKMELWQKTYKCPHCGLVIDRDINAALNLEKLAYC